MKKILLGTTALISASMIAGAANAGQTPTVTVGGFADFQAGFVSEDQDTARRSYLFQNDTEVSFNINGKADNGLEYGGVIELEADVSADADGEGFNADKTYLFLQGKNWGRVEMGANYGSAQALTVDPRLFSHGTGGVDGDWYDFVNLTWSGSAPFILSPDLPVAHGAATASGISGAAGSSEDATKVTYYTPRFSGFQLGVSFTPDAGNAGTAAGFTSDANGDYENVFEGGVNYKGKFQNVGVDASLTGEFADSEVATVEDLAAYALGLNLSYMGWSFGGSWGDWGDDTMPTGSTGDASYWTLGLGYNWGAFGASAEYIDSEYANNDYTNFIIGADYKLAPGLVPYVEVNFFELDRTATTTDNDGTVVLLGTQLNF